VRPRGQAQSLELGELPEAETFGDVAASVEFLMGDGGRNITGTVMTVDAGNTA